ncbi:MAG: flavodoxin family protein [Erysipelotrichaceae bacterium]
MMKLCVVYYSLSGNCELLANWIEAHYDADCVRLHPVKPYKNTPMLKYFWGGKSVVMQEHVALQPYNLPTASMEHLVIITPIWVSTYAPVFRNFFEKLDFDGPVSLIMCHAGGKQNKCIDEVSKALQQSLYATCEFLDPLKQDNALVTKKLEAFMKKIVD